MVRMERYRFAIPLGGGSGLASTIRSNNVSAKVVESNAHFQIDFENKQVVIDRMAADFQLSMQGASISVGSGVCTKLEQREF